MNLQVKIVSRELLAQWAAEAEGHVKAAQATLNILKAFHLDTTNAQAELDRALTQQAEIDNELEDITLALNGG